MSEQDDYSIEYRLRRIEACRIEAWLFLIVVLFGLTIMLLLAGLPGQGGQ